MDSGVEEQTETNGTASNTRGMTMAVSTRVRFEVFKRDRFTCQYCGRTPPQVVLNVDHIVPVSKGGKDSEANLATSCFECNNGKSDIPLGQVPTPLAARAKLAEEKRKQLVEFNEMLMEEHRLIEKHTDQLGCYWNNKMFVEKDRYVFDSAREGSIKVFLKHLACAEIFMAMDIAHSKHPPYSGHKDHTTWKYFCGICWRMIREKEGK